MSKMKNTTNKIYPHFAVQNNKNPNKLYAFPLLGIIIKGIMVIPQFIMFIFLLFIFFPVLFINWFIILFTGKYWDIAYNFFVDVMRFGTKIGLFLYGLTDTYPGFDFDTKGIFELDIEKPKNPNRWMAFPIFGLLFRMIMLIPYIIFDDVLSRGAGVAVFVSWFAVLFKNIYPESLYEFERDSLRVSNSLFCYLVGLKDNYPSFTISMNHQNVKIALLLAGALLAFSGHKDDNKRYDDFSYMQQQYIVQSDLKPLQ